MLVECHRFTHKALEARGWTLHSHRGSTWPCADKGHGDCLVAGEDMVSTFGAENPLLLIVQGHFSLFLWSQ